MGTVFRRSYKDKKTRKTKRVRRYSIKYQNSAGVWVTEPTDASQRHVALRLLLERERQVQGPGLVATSEVLPASAIPPVLLTLTEIVDHYLPYLRLRVKNSTLQTREDFLRGTVKRLGLTAPQELTSTCIQAYVDRRLHAGTLPQTVNLEMRFLRRALAWAQEQGHAAANPLQGWEPLREQPVKKRRAMQPEEVRKLLAASPLHRRVVYAVFLASGLRRGELIQLLRTDLELDRNLLIVRPEISKSGKLRRVFLPGGLVELLKEYGAQEARRRRERQDAYLKQVRGRLARREAAGEADTSRAETLRALEDRVLASRSHDFLFVNGRGLPIRQNNNLLREFRHDLKRAGVDPTGLDLHALRHTCNTVLLQGGVKPAIVRARMGHTTARMTDVYTDVDALDQGGSTAPVAALLGVADDDVEPGVAAAPAALGPAALTLDPGDILRPTPAVLAALVERYSNVLIARICKVSEMAVRKWLKAAGLVRTRRMVSPMLPEYQVALLRADLRAALAEESAREERKHAKEPAQPAGHITPVRPVGQSA